MDDSTLSRAIHIALRRTRLSYRVFVDVIRDEKDPDCRHVYMRSHEMENRYGRLPRVDVDLFVQSLGHELSQHHMTSIRMVSIEDAGSLTIECMAVGITRVTWRTTSSSSQRKQIVAKHLAPVLLPELTRVISDYMGDDWVSVDVFEHH